MVRKGMDKQRKLKVLKMYEISCEEKSYGTKRLTCVKNMDELTYDHAFFLVTLQMIDAHNLYDLLR